MPDDFPRIFQIDGKDTFVEIIDQLFPSFFVGWTCLFMRVVAKTLKKKKNSITFLREYSKDRVYQLLHFSTLQV